MGDLFSNVYGSPGASGLTPHKKPVRRESSAAPGSPVSVSRSGVADRADLSLIPAESAIVAPARSDEPPKLDRAAMNRAIQNYDRDGSGMDPRVAGPLRAAPDRLPIL